jgi:hypothetical protein
MKNCGMCGNEIADTAGFCRYCGNAQRGGTQRRVRSRILTVNIEARLPTVEEGVERLRDCLRDARRNKVRVLRVIHGWGSSGSGGRLREACRSLLTRELKAQRLKRVVPGEEYALTTVAGRALIAAFKELRSSERSDAYNPGITMVEL